MVSRFIWQWNYMALETGSYKDYSIQEEKKPAAQYGANTAPKAAYIVGFSHNFMINTPYIVNAWAVDFWVKKCYHFNK